MRSALVDKDVNRTNYYGVFVNDVAIPINVQFNASNDNTTGWYETTGYYNLVGKNLILGHGEANHALCTTILDESVMSTLIASAITAGNFSTVAERIIADVSLLGYDMQYLVVAQDPNAGINPYIDFDCSYEYKDSTWTIFLYALPASAFWDEEYDWMMV